MSNQAEAALLVNGPGAMIDPTITVDQAEKVLDMIEAMGATTAMIGTKEALEHCGVRCPDCYGQGYHQDDSHPGNAMHDCERCAATGYVPRAAAAEKGTEDE